MTRTWTAAAAAAVSVLAAVIECVGVRQGSWADLAAAGFRNLLLAGAVVILAEVTRSRARSATPAPSPKLRIELDFVSGTPHVDADDRTAHVTPDDWVGMVRREVGELAALADHLYGMMDVADHESEVTEEPFVRLDDLRWLLGSYVLKGGRIRRLAQLPDLLTSIGLLDQPEAGQPQRPIDAVRASATELLKRIRQTNAVTADWLLAHRVVLPDPAYLDSNGLLDRYDRLEVAPISVSGDPLYLLTCHIHDILETVESLGDVDHPVLDVLETQIANPLITIEREITTAQAFNAALISLAREVRSDAA